MPSRLKRAELVGITAEDPAITVAVSVTGCPQTDPASDEASDVALSFAVGVVRDSDGAQFPS
jgi:hypothetical protein